MLLTIIFHKIFHRDQKIASAHTVRRNVKFRLAGFVHLSVYLKDTEREGGVLLFYEANIKSHDLASKQLFV